MHRDCADFVALEWKHSQAHIYITYSILVLLPFPPFLSITSQSLPHTHLVAIPMLVLIWKPVLTRTVLGSPQLRLGTQSWGWAGQCGSLFVFVHLPVYICAEGFPSVDRFTMANLCRLHFMYLLAFCLWAPVSHKSGFF
jgi:hypothetical protein